MTATRPNPALIRKLIDERETAYRLGKTPCILWVRVSTAKDEQEASFLDQQELALRYAERNGMHVCHVWAVKETGSKADKRKNFQELVSILSNDIVNIRVVVTKNRKRLKRNMQDTATIMGLAKQGIAFHYYVDGSKDDLSSSASQRLVSVLLSAVDAYEPDQFSDEMRMVYQAKADRGVPPAMQSPFGYRYNRDTRNREKDPLFESVCQRLHDEFDTGSYSITSFVDYANTHGLFGKNGALWHKGSMDKFLKRLDYSGRFVFKGKIYEGHFPTYITEERYLNRMERLTGRRNGEPQPREHVLRKFVVCSECGKVWIPELRHGQHRSGDYVYYRHKCRVGGWSDYVKESEFLEALELIIESIRFLDSLSDEVKELYREDLKNSDLVQARVRTGANRTISVANQRKAKLLDSYLDGVVSQGDYKAKADELDSLIRGAQRELNRAILEAGDIFKNLESSIIALREFPQIFNAASKENRLRTVRAFASAMVYNRKKEKFLLQWIEPFSFLLAPETLAVSASKDGLGFVLENAQERT